MTLQFSIRFWVFWKFKAFNGQIDRIIIYKLLKEAPIKLLIQLLLLVSLFRHCFKFILHMLYTSHKNKFISFFWPFLRFLFHQSFEYYLDIVKAFVGKTYFLLVFSLYDLLTKMYFVDIHSLKYVYSHFTCKELNEEF